MTRDRTCLSHVYDLSAASRINLLNLGFCLFIAAPPSALLTKRLCAQAIKRVGLWNHSSSLRSCIIRGETRFLGSVVARLLAQDLHNDSSSMQVGWCCVALSLLSAPLICLRCHHHQHSHLSYFCSRLRFDLLFHYVCYMRSSALNK